MVRFLWHCPGLNDIYVLQRLSLFARLTEGKAPPCHELYTVNGHGYNMRYYLVDGTYPSWTTFVSTISDPIGQKKAHFAQRQEAARKDVERAFGVLQARFAVVHGPAKNGIQRLCGR